MCGFFHDPKGSLQAWIDSVVGENPKRGRRGPSAGPPTSVWLWTGPFSTLKCVLECGSGRLGQC